MTHHLAGGVGETTPAHQPGHDGAMPSPRSIDADWWETHEQIQLFEPPPVTTPLFEIDPACIRVDLVDTKRIVDLQRSMSRVVWRPSPGRRLGFEVRHDDALLGIGYLNSPVFLMAARDQHLELPKETHAKSQRLNQLADLSVCVGAQPFAWHWNGGKLIATIASTLGDAWEDRYNEPLVGITTTSVWGRGSQYNRLWPMIGYTKGFGHCHVPDHVYQRVLSHLRSNNVPIYSKGHGRLWNLRQFRDLVGSENTSLGDHHGQRRGIYFTETVDPNTRPAMIQKWYERWGRPRYERTRNKVPPYQSGLETK